MANLLRPEPSRFRATIRALRDALEPGRLALWGGVVAIGVGLATRVDTPLSHWATQFASRSNDALGKWYALVRPVGWFSTWIVVAFAFWLVDRGQRSKPTQRAALVLWPIVWAGLGTYLLKMLIRRERPRDHGGEFWFRPWGEDLFSSSGLAMPSGDAAIGFAGVFILYRMAPRAWPVWFFLGYGCAFHRMLLGAHFLSDVILGSALGILCAIAVWAVHRRSSQDALIPPLPTRTVSVSKGALWLATLIAGVGAVSTYHAWRPATRADLPGIYALDQRTWPKRHYVFSPDGTYTQAIVDAGAAGSASGAGPAPHIERAAGTWTLGPTGFAFDGVPAQAERAGRGLRLTTDGEVAVFQRISGWREASAGH